jgi:chromosome segregation ATPase
MYHNLNPAEGTGVKTGHGNAANAGTTVAVHVPNETDPSKVRAVTGLLIQTTCELRVTTNQLKEAEQANQVLTDKLATKQQAEMQHECAMEAIKLATDAIVATAAATERDSTATINDLQATIGTTDRAHQATVAANADIAAASEERLAAMRSAFKKSEIQCAKLTSTNAQFVATNESVESLIAANTEAGIVNDEYAAAFEESAAKLDAAAAESAKKIAELTEANAESATKLGESTAASAESAAKLGAATAAFEESAATLAESDAKLDAAFAAAAKAEESKKRVAPGPTRVSKRAKTKN